MIFNKIEEKLINKETPIATMLKALDIGTNTYYSARRTNDMKVSMLIRIAEYLQTPVGWFFGDGAVTGVSEGNVEFGNDAHILLLKIERFTRENNEMLKQITGRK